MTRPGVYHVLLEIEARTNRSLPITKELVVTLTTTAAADANASLVELEGLPTIGETWDGIRINPHDADGFATADDKARFSVALTNPNSELGGSCNLPTWTAGTYYQAKCQISSAESTAGEWQLSVLLDNVPVYEKAITVQCGAGTYDATCLDCPKHKHDAMCVTCVKGMVCDQEGVALSTLMLEKGYWRADARSMLVYVCPLNAACESQSGGQVGRDVCEEGYLGATCGSCNFPSHYLRLATQKCEVCDPGAKALVYGMSIAAGAVFVAAGGSASFYADRRMVKVRSSRSYQMISMSRLKVLWTLFQSACAEWTAGGHRRIAFI